MVNTENRILHSIKSLALTARKEGLRHAPILTCLIGEVEMIGKNARNGAPTEEETLQAIKKFLKGVNETIKLTTNREKLESLEFEASVYKTLLPEQLSELALKDIVVQLVIDETNQRGEALTMRDMSLIISKLKGQYDGQYEPSLASQFIKSAILLEYDTL